MLFQIIQLAGAVLILGAFAAQQSKRLIAESVMYQLLNLGGGALLCVAAIAEVQYGFILLEGSWTILSGVGLWRVMKM
ncbi:MAG TPA: hypothetical protein VMU84_15015 [Thermoanaerobaculia bacterium]|nr:hypothetical protein [Thermoanaerobaculia bacterium]